MKSRACRKTRDAKMGKFVAVGRLAAAAARLDMLSQGKCGDTRNASEAVRVTHPRLLECAKKHLRVMASVPASVVAEQLTSLSAQLRELLSLRMPVLEHPLQRGSRLGLQTESQRFHTTPAKRMLHLTNAYQEGCRHP